MNLIDPELDIESDRRKRRGKRSVPRPSKKSQGQMARADASDHQRQNPSDGALEATWPSASRQAMSFAISNIRGSLAEDTGSQESYNARQRIRITVSTAATPQAGPSTGQQATEVQTPSTPSSYGDQYSQDAYESESPMDEDEA